MNYIERYWRDATPQDAIREPPMVARFRDINCPWKINTLRGVRQGVKFPWFSESKGSFQQCQVYDAPDPGDGWRLVDVDKDDYNQNGIEYWNSGEKGWLPRGSRNDKTPFFESAIYRIRIAPAVTYVPFTWEDREQLRGRWIKESDNVEIQVTAFHCNSEGVFYSEGRSAKVLVERWRFLDTGKPVGKEVTQ